MDIRKLPHISLNISWPATSPRPSSARAWLIGAGVLAGAAIVAWGTQRVRQAMGDVTMHHRPRHGHNGREEAQPDTTG